MAVARCRAGSSDYSLTLQCAPCCITVSALLGLFLNPYGCRTGTVPLMCGQVHVDTVIMHYGLLTYGIHLGLIASEYIQGWPGRCILYLYTRLQTAIVGQRIDHYPPQRLFPACTVDDTVGLTEALTSGNINRTVVVCSSEIVKPYRQGSTHLAIGTVGIELTRGERAGTALSAQEQDAVANLYAGTIGLRIEFLLAAVSTWFVGEIATTPRPQLIPDPSGIMTGYGLTHRYRLGHAYLILS